tara:strand:- start:149 stop:358 length:210 start_codon:yes stop_codon:yes gene_type:complete
MIDANKVECYVDEIKVDREECIKDVTDSPKDWEDFWDTPESQDTWDSDTFKKVWEEMENIEPLTPLTDK